MYEKFEYFLLTIQATVEDNVPLGNKASVYFAEQSSSEFLEKFSIGNNCLLPKSWEVSNSPDVFRSVSLEDLSFISSAMYYFDKATKVAFDKYWGVDNNEIVFESQYGVSLGCVRLKKTYIVKARKKEGFDLRSLMAGILIACTPMTVKIGFDTMFDSGPPVSCEVYPSERQAIKAHALDVLKTNPDNFFSGDCVHLRQKILSHLQYYNHPIDNKYGDETIKAEILLSNEFNIMFDEKKKLYERAVNAL